MLLIAILTVLVNLVVDISLHDPQSKGAGRMSERRAELVVVDEHGEGGLAPRPVRARSGRNERLELSATTTSTRWPPAATNVTQQRHGDRTRHRRRLDPSIARHPRNTAGPRQLLEALPTEQGRGSAAVYLVFLILAAVLAGRIGLQDPNLQHITEINKKPSGAHWFGQDDLGPTSSRIIYGARISLKVSFIAIGLALAVSVPPGCSPASWAAGSIRRSCASRTPSRSSPR